MKRRCPAVGILLADCRVQGPGSAEEVAAAVKYLGTNATSLGIDAILVTRGGGSMEDLWAFNERIVAEAIVHCPIPVVAAIGHETDTTIAELVADERCATPTQAAVRLTPDAPALLREVDSIGNRLTYLLQQQLGSAARLLDSIASRPVFASPSGTLAAYRSALDRCRERLAACMNAQRSTAHISLDRLALRLERCRPAALHAAREQAVIRLESRLDAAMKHRLASSLALVEAKGRELAAVSPLRVLERGYSVTTDASGRLIRSNKDALPGTLLTTQVSDGRIESRVEGAPMVPAAG
ncbi:MAG: exodeoxyribonuclease VII large subunit, partial [Planctomycetota bacterium]|nr:exodeoxyribonuclease VII large subunit [Planctomycetota bacterium]